MNENLKPQSAKSDASLARGQADGACRKYGLSSSAEIKRPILKPFSKDKFELVEPYSVTMPIFKSELVEEITVEVPKGYKTNGANIPRIFWSIFPPNSPEYLSAVIAHDYLCELKLYALADEALRQIMTNLGVAKWKIYCFYTACKIWHLIKYGK